MAVDAGESRPKAVSIVSVFLFLATGIAVIVASSLLFPNQLTDYLWKLNEPAEATFRSIGRVSGVPLLLLAVGTFSAAKGLLGRKVWAWWFAFVFSLLMYRRLGGVLHDSGSLYNGRE